MIITKLFIENYKQYRGEHDFQIAEDATIGVVGANGVGKTTIFEAIEWCLYNPRSIRNEHIRPRGIGGEVRVVVQLTTNAGDQVFEVERVLKRGGAQATVYKLNEFGGGDPLVQGTREVTEYISTRLIGLGHAAFVATFFTRQKELGFFDQLRPAERRREVGKLLGFETIKQAQAIIADERSRARSAAESLQDQYDAKTRNRDLKAEIASAKETIAERKTAVSDATAGLKQAEEATVETETRLQHLHEQRDRHNAIAGELRDLETRQQHANERVANLTGQIEYLEKRQQERGMLAEQASHEPNLRAERQRLERERERFQTRERLQDDVTQSQQTIDKAIADAKSIVESTHNTTSAEGWEWTRRDQDDPLAGIDRLAGIASSVDLPTAEQRLESFRSALFEQQCIEREAATLDRYKQRQRQLCDELDTLLKDGEPADIRTILEEQQHTERKRQSDAHATVASLMKQKDSARQLSKRLEQQHFDDACPTCGRPFSDDEAELVIATLRDSITQQETGIAAARNEENNAGQQLRRLNEELQQLHERETAIQTCRVSLNNAREYIDGQQTTVDRHSTNLQDALKGIGQDTPPSHQDVTALEKEVGQFRALRETSQPLRMLHRSMSEAQDTRREREQELSGLKDIQWDSDAYRKVSERHDAASRASSAVDQIDQELARHPQLEHDLASLKETTKELIASITEQTSARDAVGFDAAALTSTTEALQQARQAERRERETLNTADRAAREAEYRLESLRKEEEQIRELAEQAEARRNLRAELDLMYTEFSEFDRFVAQRLSPRLGDMTSDIVAEMTDGTYDRVVFDEDYGIEVFDQTGEKYALETFSGGERDAISLAARLALSRMIGSQATNPPGFLVLDEVFGSLDAERRERVLALLGQHSHEFFRQMFIISHVDDVQQSPVFDAVWQVTQQDDGSSDVQQGAGALADAVAD